MAASNDTASLDALLKEELDLLAEAGSIVGDLSRALDTGPAALGQVLERYGHESAFQIITLALAYVRGVLLRRRGEELGVEHDGKSP